MLSHQFRSQSTQNALLFVSEFRNQFHCVNPCSIFVEKALWSARVRLWTWFAQLEWGLRLLFSPEEINFAQNENQKHIHFQLRERAANYAKLFIDVPKQDVFRDFEKYLRASNPPQWPHHARIAHNSENSSRVRNIYTHLNLSTIGNWQDFVQDKELITFLLFCRPFRRIILKSIKIFKKIFQSKKT